MAETWLTLPSRSRSAHRHAVCLALLYKEHTAGMTSLAKYRMRAGVDNLFRAAIVWRPQRGEIEPGWDRCNFTLSHSLKGLRHLDAIDFRSWFQDRTVNVRLARR